MVTQSDILISGINEEELQGEFGTTQAVARVFYTIGAHGPYSVVIPKTEVSASRVMQEIRQDSQRYIDILNITF